MWSASFLPILTMWALALLMELGPHKDREKLWLGWELDPRPLGLITTAPRCSKELQGEAGQVVGIEDVKFMVMNMYKYKEGYKFLQTLVV